MRRKHQGLARTPVRLDFQSVAALAQVHLSSQNFQHTSGANKICHDSSVFVCAQTCEYLRVGDEQLGVCTIDFDVCVELEWVFCFVGVDGFFGVIVGVSLVSVIDEIVRVFPTSAEQTCGHDKMRPLLREETCFKRSAAPDSYCKSLKATVVNVLYEQKRMVFKTSQ